MAGTIIREARWDHAWGKGVNVRQKSERGRPETKGLTRRIVRQNIVRGKPLGKGEPAILMFRKGSVRHQFRTMLLTSAAGTVIRGLKRTAKIAMSIPHERRHCRDRPGSGAGEKARIRPVCKELNVPLK